MKKRSLVYIYYIFTLVGAATLLGSCQLGKHYTRPELPLPARLDTVGTDSTSLADYSWEQLYTDTTLQSLIRKTLNYNKDMLIAAARVKELAAMKRIDYANMFPALGLKVYGEKEGTDENGTHYKPSDDFYLKLGITWELDLWGNLRWARDKSLAEFMGSIENQRALKMSMIAQVAQSYFELVALDNELSIVRQTVNARRESLHLARIRFEGGLTNETAFRQAQVELARTVTLVPDLEKKIAVKENEIAFMTGEFSYHVSRSKLPEDVVLPDTLPVGLPSTLLERRPDVRQAEQSLIAANAAVGIAYTNMFPHLTLTASYGRESTHLSNMLQSPYHFLSGTLLTPIFAMGKNRAMLKAKKAAYEQAVYSYEKVVLNAFKEARNAIVEFNKTKEIYNSRKLLEKSSKSALDLAELQYINGVIGYMDLLDAQRSYLDAQIGLSNAVRDKQLTMINLYKALGGGWQE